MNRLLPVLVLVAGCSNNLDALYGATGKIADSGASDARKRALQFMDEKCGTCVLGSCATELAACASDKLCAPWERCMAGCTPGDGSCENACYVAAGKTNGAMGDVAVCTGVHCLDTCQAAGTLPALGPECESDARANCSTSISTIWADPSSVEDERCLLASDCALPGHFRPDCSWNCSDAHARYAPPESFLQLAACLFFQRAACGLGGLSCVRAYTWPSVTSNG